MKFSAPAIITSREVIKARYDAILDQLKRTSLQSTEIYDIRYALIGLLSFLSLENE